VKPENGVEIFVGISSKLGEQGKLFYRDKEKLYSLIPLGVLAAG
jgi:hypothetical protein